MLGQTGRRIRKRKRYQLRPFGSSSRDSDSAFMPKILAQATGSLQRERADDPSRYLCKPCSSGSSVEVEMTLACRPRDRRQI